MIQIYEDGTYLDNNPLWHEEDSPWKAKQIRSIIEKNSLNLKSICEIGCGAGEILNQLSEQYADDKEFVGYGISPQAFKLCNKKSKNNLIFKLSDLLEDTAVYFDIVMAFDVFEHVEDYFGCKRPTPPSINFQQTSLSSNIFMRITNVITDTTAGTYRSLAVEWFNEGGILSPA